MIKVRISVLFPSFKFVPNETVVILDEIQDCPKARLAFKSFKEDGRFEVIASGSYVGLNIDNSHGIPKPNGSEDFIEMKNMDFEEFLWALGYDDEHINSLLECFKNKIPVPEIIHLSSVTGKETEAKKHNRSRVDPAMSTFG